jgi:nucleoside-diphosphate kinase
MHPKQEKTFFMFKPDAVKRGLIGEILTRIEKTGLKVVALKMFQPTRKQIDSHYPKDPQWIERLGFKTLDTYKKYNKDPKSELGTDNPAEIGTQVRGWLINYMSSSPLIKVVVQGIHAIDMVRKMTGNTVPAKAEMGTIRGDYSIDSPVLANEEKRSIENLVHASETPKEAQHEINFWFTPDEIHEIN